jgi:predicted DNA-binding protein YlxM (UPF0122 family)
MAQSEGPPVPEFVQMGLLLDFYGGLLTERQMLACRLYFAENLSLGEIASELSISRQAVHDTVRRAEQALLSYEDKLGLVARFVEQQSELRHLRDLCRAGRFPEVLALCEKLIT